MNDTRKSEKTTAGYFPVWLINLLGFGLLIVLVLAVFFYQVHEINNSLQKNALGRSKMVASIIEENIANASLAVTTVEQIVSTFLQDKIEFIAYLDEIDPLQPEELTALAQKTGLLGIILIRPNGLRVTGPAKWLPEEASCKNNRGSLQYHGKDILLTQSFSGENSSLSCIITGIDGIAIAEMRKRSSLSTLLSSLSALPGIHSIKMIKEPAVLDASVSLIVKNKQAIAQSRLPTELGTLVVNLDARRFLKRRDQLRRQFFFFAALLLILGIFFSWFLYRFQQKNLAQVRAFEQIFAREHEAAMLGRTTSTIAHEIRNPLNAISMGLQRLNMESKNLDKEQKELITAMEKAVKRSSGIVSELQRFTRPLQPAYTSFHFDKELHRLLALYSSQIERQHINITLDCPTPITFQGDRDLINELLENLLKNALEAQPRGGWVQINLSEDETSVHLKMENGGFLLNTGNARRIGEPYFTTKTRGTGLGLALSKRIAKAHSGKITFFPDHDKQQLTVTVTLVKQSAE